MTNFINTMKVALFVIATCYLVSATSTSHHHQEEQELLGALQAAQQPAEQQQQQQQQSSSDESYQKVYEAFSKLISNVSNNSLGNARRLVSRLNQLVGAQQEIPSNGRRPATVEVEEKTEQILTRLDQVNKDTDQHTLRQLQEDVNRLVGNLSDSYLRNIRRLIERVDRVVGRPTSQDGGRTILHQSGDRLQDEASRPPGFPGWDELIVAVDRMQKSLASFVRSSTKLITSGRR